MHPLHNTSHQFYLACFHILIWQSIHPQVSCCNAASLYRQDWTSLFGHVAPVEDVPQPASAADASAAALAIELSNGALETAPEAARLVDLDGPSSAAHIDQLFAEADNDHDGR